MRSCVSKGILTSLWDSRLHAHNLNPMAQVHYLSMCCLLVYTCKPQYNKNPSIPFGIKKDNSGMCTCEENVWEPLVIKFPKYALKTTSDLIFIHINRHTYHALSLHPKFSLNHSEDIYANYDFIIYVHLYNLWFFYYM